jgi:hypothetical protein
VLCGAAIYSSNRGSMITHAICACSYRCGTYNAGTLVVLSDAMQEIQQAAQARFLRRLPAVNGYSELNHQHSSVALRLGKVEI